MHIFRIYVYQRLGLSNLKEFFLELSGMELKEALEALKTAGKIIAQIDVIKVCLDSGEQLRLSLSRFQL